LFPIKKPESARDPAAVSPNVGVRAAYEIMLADTKADLMKDDRGAVDIYV
jgi:hypothetical protein